MRSPHVERHFQSRFSAATIAKGIAIASALAVGSPLAASAQPELPEPVVFRLGDIEFLGDTQDSVAIGVGAFNVNTDHDDTDTVAELRLEYRHGRKWHSLGPLIGIMGNTDGGVFGYAGLYSDLRIGDHWLLTPAAGIAAYERGNGKDLGGTFEFHLGLDIAYRLENGARFGLKVTHISNSDLQGRNPGVESILLNYTISLGGRDQRHRASRVPPDALRGAIKGESTPRGSDQSD